MRLFLLVVSLCFLTLSPMIANAQQITQISPSKAFKGNISLKTDANNRMHLAYDLFDGQGSLNAIAYQQSTDNGQTFSRSNIISPTNNASFNPDVAVSTNGTIYVAWSGVAQTGRFIFLSKSVDNGQTFSAPRAISTAGLDQVPKLAVDRNNNLYVTYFVGLAPARLLITRSTNEGNTFSTPQQVSGNNEFAIPTGMLFDAQRTLYLFYGDVNTARGFLVKSTNGTSFSAPQPIYNNNIPSRSLKTSEDETPTNIISGFDTNPQATMDTQGIIYVTFSFGSQIMLTKSLDRGQTFTTPTVILDSLGSFSSIVVDRNNKINIAWQEGGDFRNIFFSRSQDGGLTFSPKVRLSTNANFSFGVVGTRNANKETVFSWVGGETTGNQGIFAATIR